MALASRRLEDNWSSLALALALGAKSLALASDVVSLVLSSWSAISTSNCAFSFMFSLTLTVCFYVFTL